MGFPVSETRKVVLDITHKGASFKLVHVIHMERYDIAKRRMQDSVVEESTEERKIMTREKIQVEDIDPVSLAPKAPITKMVEIYDQAIISVSGYDKTDEDGKIIPCDQEELINFVPSDHKVLIVKAIMTDREITVDEAKN